MAEITSIENILNYHLDKYENKQEIYLNFEKQMEILYPNDLWRNGNCNKILDLFSDAQREYKNINMKYITN